MFMRSFRFIERLPFFGSLQISYESVPFDGSRSCIPIAYLVGRMERYQLLRLIPIIDEGLDSAEER